MGGDSVEVEHQAIGEKERGSIGFEAEGKFVKDRMGHVLGARTDLQNGDNFVDGAHGGPDPSDGLFGVG